MRYLIFEAGSRAGYSALMFFLDYKAKNPCDDTLLMVDKSSVFCESYKNVYKDVETSTEELYEAVIFKHREKEWSVFPADELTRQRGFIFGANWYNKVECEYYNKMLINKLLYDKGINTPKTFGLKNVFIRPNTLSAGSRGLTSLSDVCVTELIDIANEYVVDMFYDGKEFHVYAREVVISKGYDKYIKFLEKGNDVEAFAKEIAIKSGLGLYRGISNIQIIRSKDDRQLYYVESSKRISGTSVVNLLLGYNPFVLINNGNVEEKEQDIEYNKWYAYEHLMQKIHDKICKYN